MYKRLEDNQVKNLMRDVAQNAVVISHVGDGEYTCNVFGNVYSSYWTALQKARKKLPDQKLAIYRGEERGEILICYDRREIYESYLGMPAIARLTLEYINDDFYEGL